MVDLAAIVRFTESVYGHFERVEIEALLGATLELQDGDRIVEIGSYLGRSSSIFLQVARERPLHVTLIDDWSVEGDRARASLASVIERIGTPLDRFRILAEKSFFASLKIEPGIGLVFIDGDHSEGAVWSDAMNFLPKLRPGGFACFHDYARPGADGHGDVFPGVTKTVNHFTRGWDRIGLFDTLYIARKPLEERSAA